MTGCDRGEARTARHARVALACLALPPALIAVLQLGRLHPDEVFQALEPAHYVAFGQGWISWEWEKGLRNWALPGALGGLLKLGARLGLDDPQGRRALLELPQYALHALSLGAVYRLIRRRAPEAGAPWWLLGTALLALYAPVLHFAGRTLSESFSTSFLLWGLERADASAAQPTGSALAAPRRAVLAGVLLGLAVVVRYGSAVLALAAVLYLACTRRAREALWVALGGALVAALLGALDALSWGRPFHSLIEYVAYNVLSGEAAAAYGREPASFYGEWLVKGLPAWFWPGAALAAYYLLRRPAASAPASGSGLLLASALAYLTAITLTDHKEVRFLYPALVVASAAVAPAWIGALARLRRACAAPLLALSLAAGLALLAFPQTRFSPRATEQFRLFVKAARGGTGVVITKSGKWGAPGYFYAAGKPWKLCDRPDDPCTQRALKSRTYNRVVGFQRIGAKALRARGFDVLEEQGNFTLWGRAE